MWFDSVSEHFEKFGFHKMEMELCIFRKDGMAIVCHVYELLIFSENIFDITKHLIYLDGKFVISERPTLLSEMEIKMLDKILLNFGGAH